MTWMKSAIKLSGLKTKKDAIGRRIETAGAAQPSGQIRDFVETQVARQPDRYADR